MARRTLEVIITGDARSIQKAFGDTEHSASTFSSKMDAIGEKMRSVGTKMTIGLTAPLVLLGKAAFNAASDFNESLSKVNVVFGENAREIVKWSKTSATSMGISQQAALEAAGTFGNLFSALGVGGEDMTAMSTSLVQLASDLASFNNANPEDVLIALRAGLVGEAEPLRKFGVSLSAVRIEAEAVASGLVKPVAGAVELAKATIAVEKANIVAAKALKAGGVQSLAYRDAQTAAAAAEEKLGEATKGNIPDLTAAQKAMAAYQIIMKDTALAQGDFSRTASGAANQQRILAALFENTKAKLGQALIPIFQTLAGVLQKVSAFFTGLSPEMRKVVVIGALVVAAIGPMLGVFGSLITIIKGLGLALTFLAAHPALLGLMILATIAILIATHWDEVKAVLGAVWSWITNAAGAVIDWFKANWLNILGTLLLGPIWLFRDEILGFIGDLVGFGVSMANAIIGGFKSAWNAVANIINDVIPNEIGLPFGLSINLPDNPIPRLHSGGVFRSPTPGGEGLALLRDREVVSTPGQAAAAGGGMMHVTIMLPNGRVIADEIRPYALQDARAGSSWVPS